MVVKLHDGAHLIHLQSCVDNCKCHYCGGIGHIVANGGCEICEKDIAEGKCKRNHENKVVLPTGAWIPRHRDDDPNLNLKDRVERWHIRNPGQQAAAVVTGNANPDADQLAGQAAIAGMLYETIVRPPAQPAMLVQSLATTTFPEPLTKEDRIAMLEREITNLRGYNVAVNAVKAKGTFDGVEVPKPPYQILRNPGKAAAVPTVAKESAPTPAEPAAPAAPTTSTNPDALPTLPAEPSTSTANASTDKGKGRALPTVEDEPDLPLHPFARPDTKNRYVPPTTKNTLVTLIISLLGFNIP
ncbi:hypothetical protein H0H93_014860 [Arthromyces matolae]|nr:hypothetical protein H0H93_014860 [Arthromyces matolae]